MVQPGVPRGFHRSVGFAVLHQCIRPLIGACCAPGNHGYQRACVLISCQASNGPSGSPGFASAGKTGPPSRLILSQTSAGKMGTNFRPPDIAEFAAEGTHLSAPEVRTNTCPVFLCVHG